MPRPTTKTECIAAANNQWDKMHKLIAAISDAPSVVFDFGEDPKRKEAHWKRDKNLRDVLIHLYEWHQLLLNWTAANMAGDAQPFLPAPYTWKNYGDMNVEFCKKHQSTSYDAAMAMLCESHTKVMALIASFTNEELFEKKYFSWTGTTSVGSYCISATSSHYDWAIKKIKLHIKTNMS